MSFLDSLKGKSKSIFTIAALLLVLNNIAAGVATFSDMVALGETLKEIFQALGYGTAFLGGLALFSTLSEESVWLSRIAALLETLGIIGTGILALAYILNPLGILEPVPGWVGAMGAGVLLGQLGLALLGIVALRSTSYSPAAALALFGPLLAFIVFIVGAGIIGEEAAPDYVPFLVVTLQTVVHLVIAFTQPAGPVSVDASPTHEASLA